MPRGPPNFADDADSRSAPSWSRVTPICPTVWHASTWSSVPCRRHPGRLVGRLHRPDLVVGVLQWTTGCLARRGRRPPRGRPRPTRRRRRRRGHSRARPAAVRRPAAPRNARPRCTPRGDAGRRDAPRHGPTRARPGAPIRSPQVHTSRARPRQRAAAVTVARSSRSRAARPSRCARSGPRTRRRPRRATPGVPRVATATTTHGRGRHGWTWPATVRVRRAARHRGGVPRGTVPPRGRPASENGSARACPGGCRESSERLRAVSALRLHADAEVAEADEVEQARQALLGDQVPTTSSSSTATCDRGVASPCCTTCGSRPSSTGTGRRPPS